MAAIVWVKLNSKCYVQGDYESWLYEVPCTLVEPVIQDDKIREFINQCKWKDNECLRYMVESESPEDGSNPRSKSESPRSAPSSGLS